MGIITDLNTAMGRNTWPPAPVRHQWELAKLFAALRDNNETVLRMEAGRRYNDPYIINPLPRLVSRASANLLFGQPAKFTAGNDTDEPLLDELVAANALDSELVRAALIASSEGSVWGRVVVQPALSDYPIIEWVSPARVIPEFVGRFPVRATFVTEYPGKGQQVVRVLETYEPGAITTTAYRGTGTSLGQQVSLDSIEQTAGTPDQVLTGIDQPLIAFIPNSLAANAQHGVSDYDGLLSRFLALNEGTTIAQQNLRLAGRKRALIDAAYLDSAGRFVDGDDVFVRSDRDEMLGEGGKPLQVIDYNYESAALTAWLDHLLDSTLTYAGIAPQSVGRNVDGGAVSGTALRLKMNHTLIEAAGKGRYFDRGIRRLLKFAQLLDARPTTQGGFGRRWAGADLEPTVERHDGLIRDDAEAANMIATLLNAEGISHEQAVRELHPDWTPEQVTDELARIEQTNVALQQPPTIAATRPAINLP